MAATAKKPALLRFLPDVFLDNESVPECFSVKSYMQMAVDV